MQIDKKADFIMKNGRAIYPPVISDESLELYYDTKGKKNTDTHKDKLLDMSGNGRHGELQSFSYKNLSGYQEDSELVFDGIDDKLTIPKLSGINPSNFTYQLNNNILAFTGDEVKTVKDGNVEVDGRNLIPSSVLRGEGYTTKEFEFSRWAAKLINTEDTLNILESGGEYTISYDMELTDTTDVPTLYSLGAGLYLYSPGGHGSGAFHFTGRLVNKGDKYRYVRTFTAPELVDHRVLMYSNRYTTNGNSPIGLDTLKVTNLKLERGNKATDWTPAPEDLIETTDLKGNILGDMEDTIDDHTRDEQSGVEVFTDKADDSLVRVEVDGQSYQHAGSGKNLFNLEKLKSLSPTSWATTARVYDFNIKENTEYTLSTNLPRGQNELYINGSLSTARNVYLGKALTIETDSSGKIFIAVPSERERSNDILNGKYWIQLEEGSTATPYEPPAPTPDHPIEIHSLNDFDVVSQKSEGGIIDDIEVGGRNLLLNSDMDNLVGWAHNDVSIIEMSDGFIKNTMNSSASTPGIRTSNRISLKKGVYTLSVRINTDNLSTPVSLYLIGNYSSFLSDIPKKSGWNTISVTFELVNDREDDHLYILTSTPVIDDYVLYDWIKLERGNKATDWTPAPEDISENDNHPLIDKINLSLSEPLRSVGDVKDRLFRDNSDGLWKFERNVGEVTLDGTEPWSMEAHYWYMGWSSRYGATKNSFNVKSSHFVWRDSGGNDGVTTGITYGGKNLSEKTHNGNLIFYHPMHSSVAEFKEFLKSEHLNGTPVIIQHELESPEIETLDQELQDKLNNLRSFQDSNYVYTIINQADDLASHVSEKLKPMIHTEFLAHDHFKESRTVNNLLIWNRSLEDEELLNQNKLFHERFNMRSNTVEGEPITQEMNLLSGGVFGHSLEQNYTIEI